MLVVPTYYHPMLMGSEQADPTAHSTVKDSGMYKIVHVHDNEPVAQQEVSAVGAHSVYRRQDWRCSHLPLPLLAAFRIALAGQRLDANPGRIVEGRQVQLLLAHLSLRIANAQVARSVLRFPEPNHVGNPMVSRSNG